MGSVSTTGDAPSSAQTKRFICLIVFLFYRRGRCVSCLNLDVFDSYLQVKRFVYSCVYRDYVGYVI